MKFILLAIPFSLMCCLSNAKSQTRTSKSEGVFGTETQTQSGDERNARLLTDDVHRSLKLEESASSYEAALRDLGTLFRLRHDFAAAESLYRRALATSEKDKGSLEETARTLNELGALLQEQARYADAQIPFERALAIREQSYGANHPLTAIALNNLANTISSQGRYLEAEKLGDVVLYRFGEKLGQDELNPRHANARQPCRNRTKPRGRFVQAEEHCRRALVIREKAAQPNDAGLATSLNNLGMYYSEEHRFPEAEPLLQRALAIWSASHDSQQTNVAAVLCNLSVVWREQGKYAAEATREHYRARADHLGARVWGPEHSGTLPRR